METVLGLFLMAFVVVVILTLFFLMLSLGFMSLEDFSPNAANHLRTWFDHKIEKIFKIDK